MYFSLIPSKLVCVEMVILTCATSDLYSTLLTLPFFQQLYKIFCKYAKEHPNLGMTQTEFAEFLNREQEVSFMYFRHFCSVSFNEKCMKGHLQRDDLWFLNKFILTGVAQFGSLCQADVCSWQVPHDVQTEMRRGQPWVLQIEQVSLVIPWISQVIILLHLSFCPLKPLVLNWEHDRKCMEMFLTRSQALVCP